MAIPVPSSSSWKTKTSFHVLRTQLGLLVAVLLTDHCFFLLSIRDFVVHLLLLTDNLTGFAGPRLHWTGRSRQIKEYKWFRYKYFLLALEWIGSLQMKNESLHFLCCFILQPNFEFDVTWYRNGDCRLADWNRIGLNFFGIIVRVHDVALYLDFFRIFVVKIIFWLCYGCWVDGCACFKKRFVLIILQSIHTQPQHCVLHSKC